MNHTHMRRYIVMIVLPAVMVGTPGFADGPASSRWRDDCGAVCLYIALRSLDVEVDGLEEVTSRIGEPPEGGYSLDQLEGVAQSYGMQVRSVETSTENLSRRPGRFACIAHYTQGHFVNLINVEPGLVHLIDSPQSMRVPIETFESFWSRNALLISAQPIIAEDDLPIERDWRRISWIAPAVVAVGIIALLMRRMRTRQANVETD